MEMSEIIFCNICKKESEIFYCFNNDEVISSETACKCKRIEVKSSNIKPLDAALLKLKDVLNESNFKSTR